MKKALSSHPRLRPPPDRYWLGLDLFAGIRPYAREQATAADMGTRTYRSEVGQNTSRELQVDVASATAKPIAWSWGLIIYSVRSLLGRHPCSHVLSVVLW